MWVMWLCIGLVVGALFTITLCHLACRGSDEK